MAKTVFYSFHYARDSWRVQQIINLGALDGQPVLNSQDWEAVKRQGDAAIEKWIAEQMSRKRALVVLVGAETAARRWVLYEIQKAWADNKPIVGVRIHGLADTSGSVDSAGANPFASIQVEGGGTLANYLTLHTPAGTTSKDVYASIAANIGDWVDGANRRA